MKLLPCPFCGEEPGWIVRFDESLHHRLWSLRCACGVEAPEYAAEDLVVKHWNTRATPPPGSEPQTPSECLHGCEDGVIKGRVLQLHMNGKHDYAPDKPCPIHGQPPKASNYSETPNSSLSREEHGQPSECPECGGSGLARPKLKGAKGTKWCPRCNSDGDGTGRKP